MWGFLKKGTVSFRGAALLVIVGAISFALTRVWMTLAINLHISIGPSVDAVASIQALVSIIIVARFLTDAVFVAVGRRIPSLAAHPTVVAGVPIALSFGTLFVTCAANGWIDSFALLALGAVCCGIGIETFWLLWSELFVSIDFDKVKTIILAKIGIDAVCALVFGSLPYEAAFVLLVVLPLVCLVGFRWAWSLRASEEPATAAKPWRNISLKQFAPIGIGVVMLCFGFNFSQSGFQDVLSGIDNSYTLGNWVSIIGRFVTFAVMFVALKLMKDCHFEVLFRASIVTATIGFLSLILPFDGRFACFSIAVIVASFIAENAITLLTVYAAKHATNSPVQILAWGQLALRAGGLLGVIAGNAIAHSVSTGMHEEVLPYLVSLEVLLLTFAAIYFVREQNISRFLWEVVPGAVETSESDGAPYKTALLADAYGLTQREQEVLGLLLRGRSIPYIKETLYISTNTAKTHVRHIYQKMGIHERQELLTLANTFRGK